MRYFCDRNLGRMIPEALKKRGIDVITHDDVFEQDTHDEVWLTEAGRQGWTVITKDDFIRFKEDERAALLAHNVGCFVLMRRNDTAQQLLTAIEVAWQRIEEISASEQRPFIYAIYKDGSMSKRNLPEP